MRENCDVEDMEDVTTADILAYRQSLQHLAGSTQKRYLAAIKSCFAWALDAEIIPTNPAASLRLPRAIGSRAPVFMTLDETRKLLNTAELPGDVPLFWPLACNWGLRLLVTAATVIRVRNGRRIGYDKSIQWN